MDGARRFRWALIGAGALHLALVVALSTPHTPRARLSYTRQPKAAPAIGVELQVGPQFERSVQSASPAEPASESMSATAPESHRSATRAGPAVPAQTEMVAEEGDFEVSSAASAESPPSVASGTPETAGKPKRLSAVVPQDHDFSVGYALSRAEAPTNVVDTATTRLRQSMQQLHANKDRELGLIVPAPLMLALESAAREVAIPSNAVATFTANFDGSGQLLSLEFDGSNHASPQWQRLSSKVEQLLRNRKLSIAKNTKGVDIRLRLEARRQMPSGADPGTTVEVFHTPVKKGQGKRSSKIAILDPVPQVLELEIGDEKLKVPAPGLVFNLLSVGVDPSDIGAPERQVIRVQVLQEKVY